MWPGQQQPGGGQNPPQPNPYQQPGPQQPGHEQPNPYQQQPGYSQPNPYQQPTQWDMPQGPKPGGGGWDKGTKLTAVVAASAVVLTAAVTGFLVLGKDDDKKDAASGTGSSPSASAKASPESAEPTAGDDGENPRGGDGPEPTIKGWKVVVNPKWGTAFDVPADWKVESPGVFIGYEDEQKGDGTPLIGMSAPAYYQEKWCSSDDDHDGTVSDKALGTAGTKGQNGAKNTEDVARNDSAWWVFGGYTDQKDSSKKLLVIGEPKPFTTASGVEGSVATTYSKGVPKKGKCDTDGKATTFAFKNSAGDFVSWTFHGVKGTKDEIPDATVQKILSTVRLHGDPTG
jgi:hypothetical protein